MRSRRCFVIGLLGLFGLLAPAASQAADPLSSQWSAFGEVEAIAADAQVELSVSRVLRWDAMRVDTTLLVIAPTMALNAAGRRQLQRFVDGGGRLIFLDDYGPGDTWAAPLGIRWHTAPVAAPRSLHELPQFPIYSGPELGDRLGFGVPEVVLNRPASMSLVSPARARFAVAVSGQAPRRSWLIDLRRAAGAALFISDSSVLINEMTQRVHGNRQFTANLLRYFCAEKGPCRVHAVIAPLAIEGSLSGWGTADLPDKMRAFLDRVLAWLGGRWWGLVLVMLLLGLFVGHRARSLVIPEREQAEVPPPQHTLEGHLLHTGPDYTEPAVHLAAHLGHVIRQLTSAPQQIDQPVDLEELRETLRALIHQGRISGRAGGRIEQLLTYLQTLTEVDAVPVDAERFTALAGEIEWAEQVLVHTLGPKSGDAT